MLVSSQFGKIDILVNNAGIYLSGTTESTSLEVWEKTFAVNVRGVFLGSEIRHSGICAGPAADRSSTSARTGALSLFPMPAAYVASKGAEALTDQGDGIRGRQGQYPGQFRAPEPHGNRHDCRHHRKRS